MIGERLNFAKINTSPENAVIRSQGDADTVYFNFEDRTIYLDGLPYGTGSPGIPCTDITLEVDHYDGIHGEERTFNYEAVPANATDEVYVKTLDPSVATAVKVSNTRIYVEFVGQGTTDIVMWCGSRLTTMRVCCDPA